ncbi:hypothetical protein FUT69_02550 [Xylella taiwanensis]|nr:hypothetical protein AB672_08645 [Xylella taiwanensis]NBI36118.1 hypothetical protein [Xylella taiwanensis]QKD99600.1 hypothetical protein PLS229_08685 [Xylella taiwanensis]
MWESVLKIKFNEFKEFIADHSLYILVVFFFVPMIISKCAILMGATDIGFVSGWETSYREAFGGAEGYSFTVVMYWVMSPLLFLLIHSRWTYQSMPLKKAIMMVPVAWLISILLGVIVFKGVSVAPRASVSYLSTRFDVVDFLFLGRWHFGFCMIYAFIVLMCVALWYYILYLSLCLILNRL